MLNTNDYPMPFTHHHLTSDQQFYHNLYTTTSSTVAKKFDLINNNNTNSNEIFIKDVTENTRRFSVNNLLKSPNIDNSTDNKSNGKKLQETIDYLIFKIQLIFIIFMSLSTRQFFSFFFLASLCFGSLHIINYSALSYFPLPKFSKLT